LFAYGMPRQIRRIDVQEQPKKKCFPLY
jgi:hypothetical protein